MNEYIKNIKYIANTFEIGMKKGYTSILILLILKKHPCHGYLIIKEIKKHTQGVWNPSVSTMYPLLDSLKNKGLIKYTEKIESGRLKKIYEITTKGENTLKILLQKLQKMIDSMVSTVFSTLGFPGDINNLYTKEVEKLITYPTTVKWLNGVSIKEKIKNLRFNKRITLKRISLLKKKIASIDKMLISIENLSRKITF